MASTQCPVHFPYTHIYRRHRYTQAAVGVARAEIEWELAKKLARLRDWRGALVCHAWKPPPTQERK